MPHLSDQDNQIIEEIWSHNLSLAEVWRTHKQVYLHADKSFIDATVEYLSHLQSQSRSPDYVNSMRWVLDEMRTLITDDLPLSHHTTFLVQCGLKKAKNQDHKRRRLSSFYSWCHKMRYLPAPLELKAESSNIARPDPGILSNNEVNSLLEHAGGLLGHLWLCLCLGLRVAEATRVDDLDCRDGFLIVGAKASKTRSRRVIKLPVDHDKYWRFVSHTPNLRARMESLRESAGVRKWPRNCMRHTAASHWLNHYQDEQKAALHLGHSPAMLHRHYKALVTQKETEEFFELWR